MQAGSAPAAAAGVHAIAQMATSERNTEIVQLYDATQKQANQAKDSRGALAS